MCCLGLDMYFDVAKCCNLCLFCMLSLCVLGSEGQYGSYSSNNNETDKQVVRAAYLKLNYKRRIAEYYAYFYESADRYTVCMEGDVERESRLIGQAVCAGRYRDTTWDGSVVSRYCDRRTVKIKCKTWATSLKDCYVFPYKDGKCCKSALEIICITSSGGNSGSDDGGGFKPLSRGIIAVICVASISFCSCCCGLCWKCCKSLAKSDDIDDDHDQEGTVERIVRVTPALSASAPPLMTVESTSPLINPDNNERTSRFVAAGAHYVAPPPSRNPLISGFVPGGADYPGRFVNPPCDAPPNYGEVGSGGRAEPPPPSYEEALALDQVVFNGNKA